MINFRFKFIAFFIVMISLISCEYRRTNNNVIEAKQTILDTSRAQYIEIEKAPEEIDSLQIIQIDSALNNSDSTTKPFINPSPTAKPKALELVNFAKSLLKTPYVYGGKDPKTGFDSSGFISFVFTHFNISVPATANEFSSFGKTISIAEASEGDLILISKSEFDKKVVGYVGIITSSKGAPVEFIYVNSGKVKAVTISSFNSYYQKRLVKVVNVLP